MTDGQGKTSSLAGDDRLFADTRTVQRPDDALQSNYTTSDVIKRIWREHLRPRWHLVAIASIAMIISAATTGAVPLLIEKATDEIFVNQNRTLVYTLSIAVLIVTLLKTTAEYISNVTVQYLGIRFIADMRIRMFEQLVRADLTWLEDIHSGRFVSGFLTDATLLRQTASKAMITLGDNLLKVIVLTGTMAWYDWRLALIIMTVMPIGMLMLGRQRKKMRKSTKKTLQETGDLSSLISQTLRSIRVVRAFRQDEKEINQAKKTINRTLEFTMRGSRAKALANPIAELLTGLGIAAAIIYVGTYGISGEDSLGQFTGFMVAAMLIFQPLRNLATLQTSLEEGTAAAGRVFGIIDRKIELAEDPDAKPLKITSGEIELRNISFAYDPDNPVLNNLNLKVPAGNTVALVGPSGAGKSTILNLVLRFFDPQTGEVLIDGQNIAHVTIDSLRESTALVTQDPILFDDTLEANIAYGNKNATQEEIIEAAKIAQAHDFISAIPNGYDSSAKEAGNALSGGERQRIAIARAVLADTPILLLDEPTSSLDSEAESKVQEALTKLMQGRTVLMIAHRLATVQNADLICVIEDGAVVEMGQHNDLISRDGAYAKLCRTQFLGGIEDELDALQTQ